ncbi:hypothetical protein ATANTOWER_005647, partial [Ataeniobius toweri]|nr:hypothetical protein [Ataeniobius toweri]
KNYKFIAARQSEFEVLSQEEHKVSLVETASEALEDEIQALREENKRLRDQQSVGSSAAIKDLKIPVKALSTENTRLCKMALKGNYLFIYAIFIQLYKSLSTYFWC